MKRRITRPGKSLVLALALGMMPAALFSAPASAQIAIDIGVRVGPPIMPVYLQPPMPAPNYIWIPGYWAWDDWWGDYYWVPGTWVMAPRPGLLWTPGWWGWNNGVYLWHAGYWGPHVGWYGGINYGFGYNGFGFFGGEWRGGNFFYNRSVTNIRSTITNVYNRTVVNNITVNNSHASFAGGPRGVQAQPTPQQRMAMSEQHIAPTRQQIAHVQAAQTNRSSFASVNKGRPAMLAVAQPRPAPVGPIHPAGMTRPSSGGGVPAPAGFVHPVHPTNAGHPAGLAPQPSPSGPAPGARPQGRPPMSGGGEGNAPVKVTHGNGPTNGGMGSSDMSPPRQRPPHHTNANPAGYGSGNGFAPGNQTHPDRPAPHPAAAAPTRPAPSPRPQGTAPHPAAQHKDSGGGENHEKHHDG